MSTSTYWGRHALDRADIIVLAARHLGTMPGYYSVRSPTLGDLRDGPGQRHPDLRATLGPDMRFWLGWTTPVQGDGTNRSGFRKESNKTKQ